jgi:hypothetical protein
MTNFISTDQSRSSCVESESISEAKCTTDTDCQNKPFMAYANGRWTGQCLFSPELNTSNEIKNITKNSTGLCEIQGKVIYFESQIIERLSQGYRSTNTKFDLLQNIFYHAMNHMKVDSEYNRKNVLIDLSIYMLLIDKVKIDRE